jgi:flagellar biosynthesis/type III secretory pathway chaperone
MAQALEDLLDQSCTAALAGDLAALATLAPRIEALADAVGQLDLPTARRLRQKADRNARLLQAAARGVKAAQARLAEISAPPTLTTYDSRGRKDTISVLSQLAPRRL